MHSLRSHGAVLGAEYDPRHKFNPVPNEKEFFDWRVTSPVAAAVGKHSNSALKPSLLSAVLVARCVIQAPDREPVKLNYGNKGLTTTQKVVTVTLIFM